MCMGVACIDVQTPKINSKDRETLADFQKNKKDFKDMVRDYISEELQVLPGAGHSLLSDTDQTSAVLSPPLGNLTSPGIKIG